MGSVATDDAIEAYWQAFLSAHPEIDPAARFSEAFTFGESEEMVNELADLVVAGVKTATSSLFWATEGDERPSLQVGDWSIVARWDRSPACVIRTTELRVVPFDQVDARFARDYGQGDRTLAWWRTHLWGYYAAECARLGRESSPTMPLLCERFVVVHR